LKPFNTVACEHNLKPFSSTVEVVYGDITLGTNFLEFINVFPDQQMFPDEDYVGIISLKEIFSDLFSKNELKKVETEIRKHLALPGKSILLTMGSSGNKEFYLKILKMLNKTSYDVVAVYANILKKNEIPRLNDNILLLKFAPSIERLHKMVDISIIHGGQGTVFAAAYAGKPVIGFPMNFEQYLNLEKMVGHGVGFILSRKFFNEKEFTKTIDKIINNYNNYLIKAVELSKKLPKPRGDTNSAHRILEILKQKNLVNQ
jgi:UDP:flavonoid glycosyltransferase YjiC (YdhE family)